MTKRWEQALHVLETEFKNRERELEILRFIDRSILREEPLNPLFDEVVNRIANLYALSNVAIMLRRGDDLSIEHASAGGLGQVVKVSGTIQGACISEDKLQRSTNIDDLVSGYFVDYPGGQTRSTVMTPIHEHDLTVGLLIVYRSTSGDFDEPFEEFLGAVTYQLSVAIEHVHFAGEHELYASVDQLVFESSGTKPIVDAALERIVEELDSLGARGVDGVQILFPRGDGLEIVYSTNAPDVGVVVSTTSISGTSLADADTKFVPDVTDKQYEGVYRAMLPNMRSELAIPIRLSNVPIAVLNLESHEPNAFSGYEQALLERFANKVAVMLAFARLKDDVIAAMEQRNADELFLTIGQETANIVHDMNSAVGAATAWITRARDKLSDVVDADPELQRLFARVESSLARALERPRQLRERLSSQGSISFAIALDSAMDDLSPELAERLVFDTTGVEPDLPRLNAPSLDKILENLFRNSAQAAAEDGVTHIWVSARTLVVGAVDRDWLEIVVEDDGPGISDERLRTVFLPATGDSKSGLGFGLWWSKLVLNRVGGDIEAGHREGGGARFVMRLPNQTRDEVVSEAD